MKRFNIQSLIAIFIGLFILTGCSQDDQLIYQQDSRIYFERGLSTDVSFSIASANITRDTIYIPLRIMGAAVNNDRTFSILVDDSSTAKKGYHFDFGPLVVAANTYTVNLPVYIYRKPGLKDSIVNAYFTIGETSDFKAGYSDKYISNDPYNKLHYKISINDQLLKPTTWDTRWAVYFGTYSKTKHLFISQATGRADWPSTLYPQDISFVVQTVRYALYNYELTNGPLIDENGERVVFP